MASVPPEAESLIRRYNLGMVRGVYKPHTFWSIVGCLFIVAFGAVWTLLAASLTNSPLLPANLALFHQSIDLPVSDSVFSILGIVFPLFGLLFCLIGLWNIVKALSHRHVRAVLCTYGVAYLGRQGADAFRWEQVATVFHKVTTHTHSNRNPSTGTTSTSTTYSHTYTINCRDGRKFVFDSILGGVKRLGKIIENEVARYQR